MGSFAFSMFAKYGRFVVNHNESATGDVLIRYPRWYLRSPEVGFSSWTANGPFHGFILDDQLAASTLLQEQVPNNVAYWFLSLVVAFSCGALVVVAGLTAHSA